MQDLKESLITVSTALVTTQEDLKTVQQTLNKEKDKGKFDIILWCRDNMIPTLLGFGVLYFVLHATGAI